VARWLHIVEAMNASEGPQPSASSSTAYQARDLSVLLPAYKRMFINPLVRHLPAALSPNTITHIGHLLNLSAATMLLVVRPRGGWLLVLAAVFLQAYIWCDNADGAHARRTQQCSPLGELLDHGLDVLNVIYIALMSAATLGMPTAWWPWFVLAVTTASSFTYWEQAQTGVFQLGRLNQIEGGLLLTGSMLISAALGTDWWGQHALLGITPRLGMVLWVVLSTISGAAAALWRVRRRNGLSAMLVPLQFGLFIAAVSTAAALATISAPTAVVLLLAANVFLSLRMLSQRLGCRDHRSGTKALLATALALAALVAIKLSMPAATGQGLLWRHADTLVAALGCGWFGICAARDARRSLVLTREETT